MPRASLPVLVTCVIAACTAPATAAIINVPGDAPTIQAGIDLAGLEDEVVVADGVYTGPGNVNVDFRGKTITVRSANGPEACTVDGEGVAGNRGFIFVSKETAASRLEGFTIRNCVADAIGGGGLLALDGDPTVVGCSFRECSAPGGDGGGALARSAVFEDCEFVVNSARSGGALALYAPGGTVRNTTFVDNSAEKEGGAVFGQGEFTDCLFLRNEVAGASIRGGAISGISDVTLDQCFFRLNEANATSGYAYGGAVALVDGANLVATRCTFESSRMNGPGWCRGGAVYNLGGRTTLHGCLLRVNFILSSAAAAAAIFHSGLDFTARNCTSVNNGSGEAIPAVDIQALDAPIRFANCILKDELWQQCGLRTSGPDVDIRYCSMTGECGSGGGPGNIVHDPMVTGNGRIQPGSPCIDAGSNNEVPPGLILDIDDENRFQNDPDTPDTGEGTAPIVDIGADEFAVATCAEDLDGSGAVDFGDILAVLGAWGPCSLEPGITHVEIRTSIDASNYGLDDIVVTPVECEGDLDGSGAVDFGDILRILSSWGPC